MTQCSAQVDLPKPKTEITLISNALVICRAVLQDLSLLAIRRIMQIDSQPMEIYILGSKMVICVGDEFDS